jgi:hypothetical protein
MWINTWFRGHSSQAKSRRPSTPWKTRSRRVRPRLKQLEDRCLPSNFTAATVSDLIADINAANKAGGSNTVTLAPKTTFNLTNSTDGANGLPVIAANDILTIVGNSDTIQRKSNSPAFRIFAVAGGASLALANLTVQNGFVPNDEGGGILNSGTLSVSGCTLSGNSAVNGGGIMNFGTATVQSSTLSGNSAFGHGGGIANYPGGSMTITGCTVSHNSAPLGGGIFNYGSTSINSCTVSHNDAGQGGGGIYAAQGAVYISNSLVCNNSAMLGADLFIECGALASISNSTICNTYSNCLT